MVLLAVGLFASGWPEHIRAHPYWIGLVFVLGAVLMLFGFFPDREKSDVAATEKNLVGRDNTGNQIIAHNSTIHVNSTAANASQIVAKPEIKPPQLPSRNLPSLQVRREWRDIAYFPVPGHWSFGDRRDPNTKQGILLWLANPPASKGKRGTPACDLVAQLTFNHTMGITRIPRAYWLQQRGHQIDIGNGYESAVIVGYFDPYSSDFYSHENHYHDDGGNDSFAEAFRQLGKRYQISSERNFTVDVSIIDAESNETIEQKRLEIYMPQRILNMMDKE